VWSRASPSSQCRVGPHDPAAAGISWQAITTWTASRDPDFAVKMARILALYDRRPADGRVSCVDEFAR